LIKACMHYTQQAQAPQLPPWAWVLREDSSWVSYRLYLSSSLNLINHTIQTTHMCINTSLSSDWLVCMTAGAVPGTAPTSTAGLTLGAKPGFTLPTLNKPAAVCQCELCVWLIFSVLLSTVGCFHIYLSWSLIFFSLSLLFEVGRGSFWQEAPVGLVASPFLLCFVSQTPTNEACVNQFRSFTRVLS
jgi:hypothetical protein